MSCEKLLKQYKNTTIKIYIYSGLRRRRSRLFLIFIPKLNQWIGTNERLGIYFSTMLKDSPFFRLWLMDIFRSWFYLDYDSISIKILKCISSFRFLNNNPLPHRSITNSWIIPGIFVFVYLIVYPLCTQHKMDGYSIFIKWLFDSFSSLDHNSIKTSRVLLISSLGKIPWFFNFDKIGIVIFISILLHLDEI